MVQRRDIRGNIKTCKIHDLLRDLCLREAHKDRFLCIGNLYEDVTENINGRRRLGIHSNTSFRYNKLSTMPGDLRFMSRTRTVVMERSEIELDIIFCYSLLRVLHTNEWYSLPDILHLYNSRYLAFSLKDYPRGSFRLDKISFLPWNLETLIVNDHSSQDDITLPSEIWGMHHLRHIKSKRGINLSVPDGESYCVLNNLQTLSMILNFWFTDEILGRIPNLKKLKFFNKYVTVKEEETHVHFNLVRLQKLEILHCHLHSRCKTKINVNFPPTLRKMYLRGTRIPRENINIVGSLPNLEVLELGYFAFCGLEWNSTEGEFQCLKSLTIFSRDLKFWRADSINFPVLKRLFLRTSVLEELPWGIGEIPSLELIELYDCNRSVVFSAKEIHLDAQAQGNDDLLILVRSRDDDIQSLASHNFQVDNS